VTAGIGYLEQSAAYSRTVTKVLINGQKERVVEHQRAGLVVAGFHHGTSRLEDPQPHTHCLVMNAAWRSAVERFGALHSRPVYQHKMAAGAVYQATLANELRKLGLPVEAIKNKDGVPLGYFEVAGVSKEVRDHFSKRRQQIEEALKAKGFASAEAAEIAALDTRNEKRILPPKDELFRTWREEAAKLGLTREKAEALFGQPPKYDKRAVDAVKSAIDAAKDRLTESVSHFSERELYRETLIRTLGSGVHPEVVRQAVKTACERSGELVALGRYRGESQYTTQEVWKTEKEFLAAAATLNGRHVAGVKPGAVEAKLGQELTKPDGTTFRMTDEQKHAVQILTRDGSAIRTLTGSAGSGKTTVLGAVNELYASHGYKVIGAAVAGTAARELESGSGIKSDTLAMRFIEMDRSFRDKVKHNATQLVRAALGLPTYPPDKKLVIDKNTVLVVDEAGMIGTKDLNRLMQAVVDGGGRVILAGDSKQLPPVQAGGGFRSMLERYKENGAELTAVTRQESQADRNLGLYIASGNAREALYQLADKGKLHVGDTRA
ncbi:MAG: AAA family ATPase, partial [Gemmataceae bacterium]|nr:AAA family ATPase [Gemmataceae bacterium]